MSVFWQSLGVGLSVWLVVYLLNRVWLMFKGIVS